MIFAPFYLSYCFGTKCKLFLNGEATYLVHTYYYVKHDKINVSCIIAIIHSAVNN